MSTNSRNGKGDVVPSKFHSALPRKYEADGGNNSCDAGPSDGRNDTVGAVDVMGGAIQRRELARHLQLTVTTHYATIMAIIPCL